MGVKVRKIRGTWWLKIDYNGKRKSKHIGSRAAAKTAKQKLEAALALGDLGILSGQDKPAAVTLKDYADKWFEKFAALSLKQSTIAQYKQFYRLFVSPEFGAMELPAIRRDQIKGWLSGLAAREDEDGDRLARNTIRLALSSIRGLLSHAVEDGLVPGNPADKLGKFIRAGKPDRKAEAMTRTEADAFLAASKEVSPDYYELFLIAIRCGLRQGELIALRWSDVQLGTDDEDPNRFLLVSRNHYRKTFTTTKSNKPRRVDLSKLCRRALLALKDRRKPSGDDFVFPAMSGEKKDKKHPKKPHGRNLDPRKPLDPANLVHYHFQPALEAAGLRRFRFHDLRHSFGSHLIQDGASIAYVKEQMGHSSIQITVDTYGHLIPGGNIAWVDRLDAATNPAQTATPAQPARIQPANKRRARVATNRVQ
jgi:integrase